MIGNIGKSAIAALLFALSAGSLKADEIIVAGGCFWCVEADFERVSGVTEAVSGYTGGTLKDPTYRQVSSGQTGHYEAVKISFDAAKVKTESLYDLFFRSVDPTDPGGQFCDRGQQYATAIFFKDDAQRDAAQRAKARAEAELGRSIATPILPLETFYVAEDKHQDYYKGQGRVLTRFGVKRQSEAYKRYRKACGRDQRVFDLWGDAAPFAPAHL